MSEVVRGPVRFPPSPVCYTLYEVVSMTSEPLSIFTNQSACTIFWEVWNVRNVISHTWSQIKMAEDVEGFDSAVQNWFVYFSMLHFLRALWLAFHIQKGALTSWTRLRTEYIGRERERSERDRERTRTSENQAIHGALDPWNPYIKIEILIYCPYTFSIEVVGGICWSIN